MKFFDESHETKYNEFCGRMKYLDEYHKAVAYLLALDVVCREHTPDLFDFSEDVIKPDGLHKDWQTGTSRKTTQLLLNLFGTGAARTARRARTRTVTRSSCRRSITLPTTSSTAIMLLTIARQSVSDFRFFLTKTDENFFQKYNLCSLRIKSKSAKMTIQNYTQGGAGGEAPCPVGRRPQRSVA